MSTQRIKFSICQTQRWFARPVLRNSSFVAPKRPSLSITSAKGKNLEGREDGKIFSKEYIPPQVLPEWHQNKLKYKLERMDCLRRRNAIHIPEFYPGSIVAVTIADEFGPDKTNRFVGRCLWRDGFGLGCKFVLRNVIDGEGFEIMYHLFSPVIQSYEVLRLEKWLDTDLRYLRNADPEICTINPDMIAEAPTPVTEHLPVFTGKVRMLDKKLWGWQFDKSWPPPRNAHLNHHLMEEDIIANKRFQALKSHFQYDICRHYDVTHLKKEIMREMKHNAIRVEKSTSNQDTMSDESS